MPDQPQPSFSTWLKDHRNGLCDADLTDALMEVLDAVGRTGKNGTLTITIKVAPRGDGYEVTDTVKANVPTEPEPKLYWRDATGFLSRSNPMQPTIPFVNTETGEITR